MEWFWIALIAPALWSASNHIDKYLLTRYFKGGGVGTLIIFSSGIGFLAAFIIAIIHPEVLSHAPKNALLIALNSFLYIIALFPYLHALKKDDASTATPIFQFIPVFSYFLAWLILKETLSASQVVGGLFVIIGAIGISLELQKGERLRIKKDVFFLMAISSFLLALNTLFFKYFALQTDFWITSFWEYVGFSIFTLLLLIFVRPYRREFISVLKQNAAMVITLDALNELITIFAKVAFNFASLLAPITLVWITNGFQPLFVFIYGILLTLLFPRIASENITRHHLAHKFVAIAVMFVGTYFLNR